MLRHVSRTNHHRRSLVILLSRQLATETHTSSPTPDLPPGIPPLKPQPGSPPPAKRSHLYPRPRQTPNPRSQLPLGFGKNQWITVSDATRTLLESIVMEFEAPIRYAFAYGSGVFQQDGYAGKDAPMLDFIFAVTHPAHFHSINMHQYPSHYPLHARLLGSDFVSRVGEVSPGIWFNPYVPMKGVNIKYGVTTVDNICSDLLNWKTLYLAGRMHKPIRIIKDDPRVRLTQQVNLTSAVRAALLCLPENFSQTELFHQIAGISYAGDPRMWFPAENKGKVGNIVRKQEDHFKELYHRLVVALPGVHWPIGSTHVQQDIGPQARAALLRKLPSNLLDQVKAHYGGALRVNLDESEFWTKVASKDDLSQVLQGEMRDIVRWPATVQSLKGPLTAGPSKTFRYSMAKMGKWWAAPRSSS